MKIGIFYGSTTGNAESVADSIKEAFSGEDVDCVNIADASAENLSGYDLFVLGSSTWGGGELQDDWLAFMPRFGSFNLAGKKVALFGVGDQYGWSDTFVDAMGILYEKALASGAEIVGVWPVEGYEYSESKAVINGKFVGLAIDATNQDEKTVERVCGWVEALRQSL